MVVDVRDVMLEFFIDCGWDLVGLFDLDFDVCYKLYVCIGGFVDGVVDFDFVFFGILFSEVLVMDL